MGLSFESHKKKEKYSTKNDHNGPYSITRLSHTKNRVKQEKTQTHTRNTNYKRSSLYMKKILHRNGLMKHTPSIHLNWAFQI